MTDEQEKYIPSLGTVTGPAPSTHRVSAEPLVIPTVEQMHLIARILDGLCKAQAYEPHMFMGVVDVGRCRYCGAIGEVTDQGIRHEHTDGCALTLNDQLQKSVQSVATSQHTEGQEL